MEYGGGIDGAGLRVHHTYVQVNVFPATVLVDCHHVRGGGGGGSGGRAGGVCEGRKQSTQSIISIIIHN